MTINYDSGNETESDFSFGVRELREAKKKDRGLTLSVEPAKNSIASKGFDPYNTSGSFDRKKHWARVGKR